MQLSVISYSNVVSSVWTRVFSCLLLSCLIIQFSSCSLSGKKDNTGEAIIHAHFETDIIRHPEWSRNSSVYELNVRQHSPEGTFISVINDLERLKRMGIDVIVLTPVFEVGQKLRTGKLGDPQISKSYLQVDPSLGSNEDFSALINAAHSKGLKLLMSWMMEYSASDHSWIKSNPALYQTNTLGEMVAPVGHDTLDAAVFNWSNPALSDSLKNSIQWWVEKMDVDGFNCIKSNSAPRAFWEDLRASLDKIKPVLMICDDESRDVHLKSFDISIASEFNQMVGQIVKLEKPLAELDAYMARQDSIFPKSAFRLYRTSGFNLNEQSGTAGERFGPHRSLMDVMAFTLAGIPALYSGQEGGEAYGDGKPHRLGVCDKDTIIWNDYPEQDFYTRLFKTHRTNPALWNGEFGGSFERIKTSSDDVIYAYTRTLGDNQALVVLNFSDKPQKIDFIEPISGEYESIFNNQKLTIFTRGDVKLAAFGYQVFVK